MKLYVATDLAFDPETAWRIFESKEFEARLEGVTDLKCTVKSEVMEGPVKVKKLFYESKRDLPTIAAKALGQKNLTYNQTNRFDPVKSVLHWEVFLPVMTDRVKVSGTTTITPTATGSRRVVEGDISVKVRFIGGQIEKTVVKEFERSMSRAVELVRDIHRERTSE